MQSEAMKQEEIEALAREMAKGVKTEADLEAVTRTLTKTLIETALKAPALPENSLQPIKTSL